eukprot:1349948-Ditylum_brightwellii.AAC.1
MATTLFWSYTLDEEMMPFQFGSYSALRENLAMIVPQGSYAPSRAHSEHRTLFSQTDKKI